MTSFNPNNVTSLGRVNFLLDNATKTKESG